MILLILPASSSVRSFTLVSVSYTHLARKNEVVGLQRQREVELSISYFCGVEIHIAQSEAVMKINGRYVVHPHFRIPCIVRIDLKDAQANLAMYVLPISCTIVRLCDLYSGMLAWQFIRLELPFDLSLIHI